MPDRGVEQADEADKAGAHQDHRRLCSLSAVFDGHPEGPRLTNAAGSFVYRC
jgi:hypothetical protein